MDEFDPSLSGLRKHVAALRQSEDLCARQVELQREQEPYYRTSAQILTEQRGWSDVVFDLVAAHAKARAAAEASLDASVHLREATERLMAELEADGG